MYNKLRTVAGFTIVELVVVITVMGVLMGLLFTTFDDFYKSNVNAIAVTQQLSDTRGALHAIEDDLTYSNSVLASYTPPSAPFGSDNGTASWTYDYPFAGSPTQTLIIRMAASTVSDNGNENETHSLIINGDTSASPQGCIPSSNSTLLFNTVVFFVKDTTLYRRTINNPNPCGTPISQKPTCAATHRSNGNCMGTDARLLDNVSELTYTYYGDSPNTPLTITPMNAETLIPSARAIDITIKTSRKINGKDNIMAASTRVPVTNRQN